MIGQTLEEPFPFKDALTRPFLLPNWNRLRIISAILRGNVNKSIIFGILVLSLLPPFQGCGTRWSRVAENPLNNGKWGNKTLIRVREGERGREREREGERERGGREREGSETFLEPPISVHSVSDSGGKREARCFPYLRSPIWLLCCYL